MELPKLKTTVVHSQSKSAWNVIGTRLGGKYKIARVPYYDSGLQTQNDIREKQEAYEHAMFISTCFNVIDEMQQDKESKKNVIKQILKNTKSF